MKHSAQFISSCIVLLFFNEGALLKCRSGNQQVDAQFQKVLTTCKKRYTDSNTDNSENPISTEDSSLENDSNSEENVYDKHFFYKEDDKSYNRSINAQRNSNRNGDTNTSDRSINGNIRDFQNIQHIHKSNDQNSRDSRNWRTRKSDFYNGDMQSNYTRAQACVVQCFFNELNVVDQKGFPERDLVIPLMSHNIQDPELKDFIERSIIECFHYLQSYKREKCEFSQNLLRCLAEKGQERCEDWEN